MAGTTVADDGAVEEAFQAALDAVGAHRRPADGTIPDDYIRRTMGQSKIAVFTELLGGDRRRAERANAAFEAAFDQAVDRGEVGAIPGAEDVPGPPAPGRHAALPDHRLLPGHPRPDHRPLWAGRVWSTWSSPRPTPAGAGRGPT